MKRFSISFVFTLLAGLGLSALAHASPSAETDALIGEGAVAVLKENDRRANPYTDRTMNVRMTLRGGDDDGRQLEMLMMTKEGAHAGIRTAIRFAKPADIKGLAIVIKGSNEIYVKLPGSKKVRRVASHARKQGFQGTDFSLDDLSMLTFANDFDPKFLETSGEHIVMELKRKEGSTVPYTKLVVKIPKKTLIIDEIDYYDDADRKIKNQKRGDVYKAVGGHDTYRSVRMTDLTREHTTVLEVLELKDSTISEKTFSKRWLIRGI